MSRAGLRAALALAVTAAAADGAAAARLAFTSPAAGTPLFGPVEIRLTLESQDPVGELRLFVDGSLVARFAKPPFELRYDVGQFGNEHQFVAETTTLFGERLKATLTSPAMEGGDQYDVELVQLFVRVQGAAKASLGTGDFRVRDAGGRELEVTTLARGNVPISTVVLVDSSDSMKGEAFRQAVSGARSTAGLLDTTDEVMIALFSDRLLRATDFTRDRGALARALEGVEPNGGSAVYDHFYFGLNRLKTRLGRPVLILLSDGEDVSSTLDADEIRWRARRSQATIYWVRLEAPGSEARRFATFWKDEAVCLAERATLEAVVTESGGAILPIASVGELSMALIQIFDDLRSQYVVGFQPPDRRHDGEWRPLSVRVLDPRATVSARAGYVDD